MMKPYVPVDPDLISAENEKTETPLHQACHQNGQENLQVLKTSLAPHTDEDVLLMESDLGYWDRDSEEFSSLDDDYVNESVQVQLPLDQVPPVLPLLWARCSKRFTSYIFQDFISEDTFLCPPYTSYSSISKDTFLCPYAANPIDGFLQDKEGRTTLHLAAVKGRLNFLEEIILSIGYLMKNNKIDVVIRYLMKYLHIIKLGSSTDNDGNTIIHLTTTTKLNEIITYLVTKRGTDVNVLNRHGLTPFAIVDSDIRNFPPLQLSSPLGNAGHKNSSRSLLQPPEIENTTIPTVISGRSVENTLIIDMSPFNLLPSILDIHYHARHLDLQTEEDLQNTRNRMIIAAVLIATSSFVAGINPPFAVHQEGMTSRNMTTAYMVFLLCNNVAFFSSLGITGTLFSTIHFSRTSMIKLLAVAYKIMWVSLSFTVAAYIAAAFMI